jgi:diguanylate cyclase (GGDEF)-like protein/PAS domain S-box-containing protein
MAVIWPANGLVVGLLAGWMGRPYWPAIAGCGGSAVAAHMIYGDSFATAALLGCLNFLEIALGVYLLLRLGGQVFELTRLKDLRIIFLVGAMVAAVGASMASLLLPAFQEVSRGELWLGWFSGETAGMWLGLPLGLTFAEGPKLLHPYTRQSLRRQALEAFLILLAVGALVALAFAWHFPSPGLFTPILLWIALRRGPAATAAAVLVFSLLFTVAISAGGWLPAGHTSWSITPLKLQVLLLCTTVPPLALAVLAREREFTCLELKRRHNENALYRAMVQELPDCLNVKGLEGRFIAANPATARLMGASSPEALLGRTDHDFYPADLADRYARDERTFLARKETIVIEQPMLFPDGSQGWLSSLKAPFHDAAGALVGIVTHNRDITRRKQLEIELADAKRQLEEAIASMPDGFAVLGPDGRIVMCNQQYRELLPLAADLGAMDRRPRPDPSVASKVSNVVLHDVDQEPARGTGAAFVRQSGLQEIRLSDGRWLDARSHAVADGSLIVCLRDITERKQLELQLATAKAQVEDALQSMADGFAVFDGDDRLELCNDRYQEIFASNKDLIRPGISREELVRATAIRGGYIGVDSSSLDDFVHRTVNFREGNRNCQMADGRWIDISARRTRRGGTMFVYRDITERKLLETQLHHRANHDPMTKLANRAMFHDELERRRLHAVRTSTKLGVMMIDLDRFKAVNDTYGHEVGDRLLIEIAKRLKESVRDGDVVARLGGDEFVVLATGRSDGDGFAALATRLIERLGDRLVVGTITLTPACSLGLAVFPDDLESADDLVLAADRALYAAKAAGRGSWSRYKPELAHPSDLSPSGHPNCPAAS